MEGTRQALKNFRASIAPDLYSPSSYIPWPELDEELAELQSSIEALQVVANQPRRTRRSLAEALRHEPSITRVLQRIFAAPSGAGFDDGRALSDEPPRTARERAKVAGLAVDLGLWRLIPRDARVEDLVRIALVASDARRRGFRRRGEIEGRVDQLLASTIHAATKRLGDPVTRLKGSQMPAIARARVEDVIAVGDRPVAAITTVFEAQSGGRQQRNFSLTYPELQRELDSVPMRLILVADGRGVGEISPRVMQRLFDAVGACMTLSQAEDGMLLDAIVDAARARGMRSSADGPVDQIILSTLASRDRIEADALPLAGDEARLSIARFHQQHPDLALELSPLGDELQWQRADLRIASDQDTFDPQEALEIFARLMNADMVGTPVPLPDSNEGRAHLLELGLDPVIPVMVAAASPRNADREMVSSLARLARNMSNEARVAALLVPDASSWEATVDRDQLQRRFAANVVTVDRNGLRRLAELRQRPRDSFVGLILQQADLTKASPFVYTSATPERMFFGREVEAAEILAVVTTNSAAVLGGRRIGKTSLLHRLLPAIHEQGQAAYYGDCQAVGTWEEFARMARRRWGARLSSRFHPDLLAKLAEELHSGNSPPVFLLDEIDRLLGWDVDHEGKRVPEAFFRSCRALSQEGGAQFVFSGERVISHRMWDPSSPHWNFCQPIQLRQLSREAATELLVRPLESLQIALEDRDALLAEAWDVTSGHPRMVQFLGGLMVSALNSNEPGLRSTLSPADVGAVTALDSYRREYLETYWGQATAFERLISMLVTQGSSSLAEVASALHHAGVQVSDQEISDAIRMLELYGIVDASEAGVTLRAAWFPRALDIFGGAETASLRQAEQVA